MVYTGIAMILTGIAAYFSKGIRLSHEPVKDKK